MRKYNLALNCYEKAIEIDTECKEAWRGRTQALILLERHEESIKSLVKLSELEAMETMESTVMAEEDRFLTEKE